MTRRRAPTEGTEGAAAVAEGFLFELPLLYLEKLKKQMGLLGNSKKARNEGGETLVPEAGEGGFRRLR